jgi:inhibitor of cysteine peptidase
MAVSKHIQHDLFNPVFLFFALLITAVIPCSALELSETDNGGSFTITLNEELAIRLPGNPTTGYLWEVLTNEPLLKQKEETVFVSDAYRIGSGGQIKFLFIPGGIGSTRLKMIYRRPWEKETPPARMFEIAVTVKPDNKPPASGSEHPPAP